MEVEKLCIRCGRSFTTKNPRQKYCGGNIAIPCVKCGRIFTTKCNADTPITCSKSCGSKYFANTESRKCVRCGEIFTPTSSNQKYCNQLRTKVCSLCGREFEYLCNAESKNNRDICWSSECSKSHKLQSMVFGYQKNNPNKRCVICNEIFIPRNNTQIICDKEYHEFTCESCGNRYILDRNYIVRSYPNDIRRTCSEECRAKLQSTHCSFKKNEIKEKIKQTCIEKYGVEHPMQSKEIKQTMWKTYQLKTGYSHPARNPDVRKKSVRNSKASLLEERIKTIFNNYNIEYIHHYTLTTKAKDIAHEFDFYLPTYKILIDADGIYYHAYLSDPDGHHCLDYYDDIRVSLVPKDHSFYVIVEGTEENQIKQLVKILENIDNGIFNYDSYLFNWCRSIEFPYPNYTDKRLLNDWNSLYKYENPKFVPTCRLGESLIKQYHYSIYSCRKKNSTSPLEAWYDDNKLKKVIKNRLIYTNDVDPSKILRGFNISKICPVVSIFNPVLAKYLVLKYLNEFDTIFDPFSGFSGRLLGVASTNKRYIGQDLNPLVVRESNQLIEYLKLSRCQVNIKDTLESLGEYECLLTCPPYNDKEIYNEETIFKSCDEWIAECLNRFKCKKYIFVVDETQRYSDFIVEDIQSNSHFSNVKEYIIVINNQEVVT